jgi:hypothetical protein
VFCAVAGGHFAEVLERGEASWPKSCFRGGEASYFVCLCTSQETQRGVPHAGQDSTKSVIPLALHWHWPWLALKASFSYQ